MQFVNNPLWGQMHLRFNQFKSISSQNKYATSIKCLLSEIKRYNCQLCLPHFPFIFCSMKVSCSPNPSTNSETKNPEFYLPNLKTSHTVKDYQTGLICQKMYIFLVSEFHVGSAGLNYLHYLEDYFPRACSMKSYN